MPTRNILPLFFLSRHEKLPRGKLADTLAQFVGMIDCSASWDELLGKEAFEDDAEGEGKSARDVLDAKLGLGATATSIAGRRLGGQITSLGNKLNKTVKSARARVTRVGKAAENLPKEEDLDNMWWYMFVPKDRRVNSPRGREAPEDGGAHPSSSPFQRCKSAPKGSLVAYIALYAALINIYHGGVAGVAKLWSEFVKEVRHTNAPPHTRTRHPSPLSTPPPKKKVV